MIIIEKNLSTIQITENDSESNAIRINDQLYSPTDYKVKYLNVSGTQIKKYEVAGLKFNIVNNKVFGKSLQKHVFKGTLGETLQYKIPDVSNDIDLGKIKICGHDH
jgi:hypothetical protein